MSQNPFDDIERMFDRMTRGFESIEGGLSESVAVDVAETDDEYVVVADLPGFDREDIDVELAGETLTVSAAADGNDEDDDRRYLRRERPRGPVSRSVRLPEAVDPEATDAAHEAGVLTVTLPKAAGAGGRSIPID
jgi:HSP20 family protein